MKKCRITVMKTACYKDLMEIYENPITHACDMKKMLTNNQDDRIRGVYINGSRTNKNAKKDIFQD